MYVLVPAQVGMAEITGAEIVKALPQLSKTVSGVGAVDVAEGQVTVDPAFAGIVTVGVLIVYV